MRKVRGGVARGGNTGFVDPTVRIQGHGRRWNCRVHAVCADAQAAAAIATVGRLFVLLRWNRVGRIRVVVGTGRGDARVRAVVMASRHALMVVGRLGAMLHGFVLGHLVPQRHLRGRHRRRRSIQNERQDQHHAQEQRYQRHAFTLPRAVDGRTRLLMNWPPETLLRNLEFWSHAQWGQSWLATTYRAGFRMGTNCN